MSATPPDTTPPGDQNESPKPDASPPPADATASPPSTPPEPPAKSGETVGVNLSGGSKARNIYITEGDVTEIKNYVIGGDEQFFSRTFSARMAEPISDGFQQDLAGRHLHEPAILAGFVETLRRRRLLVIGGEPGCGKGSTALVLAQQVKQVDTKIAHETLRIAPLESEVRIDFRSLVTDEKHFGSRVVFFKDALARGNRDVRAFLASLDDAGLDRLLNDLTAHHAYLIFTADFHSLAELDEPLTARGVYTRLPNLEPTQLREGLRRALEDAGYKDEPVAEDDVVTIVASVRSMSRITRLVRVYWPHIKSKQLTASQALARLDDDISLWFRRDLAEDFDAWMFAFALTLGLALPDEGGVPWTELEELRASLADAVRSHIGVRERRHGYDKQRLSEEVLLHKTRAVIERSSGRDVVWFEDPGYGARLWSSLLRYNRGLLTAVVPPLLDAVEQSERRQVGSRARAARALGRIGEIDPDVILGPTLHRWAASETAYVRAAAGHLMQGALSSGRADYREQALELLDRLCRSGNTAPEGKKRLWAAIAICKQIGLLDVSLGLQKLRAIVEETLAERVVDLQGMERHLRDIQGAFEARKATDAPAALALALVHEFIRDWAREIYQQHAPALFAVQYAVVALCIMLDPVRVFRELRRWLTGTEGLRAVTVLVYLQSGGIADQMQAYAADGRGPGRDEVLNPIVAAMVTDPAGAATVADFLEDVFVSFYQVFPLEASRYLRESFFAHLCSLARQTAKHPNALEALADVFVALLVAPDPNLRTQLLEVLTMDDAFLTPGSELQQFARDVKKRSLVAGRRKPPPPPSFALTRSATSTP